MPRISSFNGIIIRMYRDDHNPPHFHATYAEYEILIRIARPVCLFRQFSIKGIWIGDGMGIIHQDELMDNWKLMNLYLPLKAIEPLK